MQIGSRIKYTFAFVVLAAFMVTIVDMIMSLNFAGILFSPRLVVPAFIVGWLIALWASQRIKFK